MTKSTTQALDRVHRSRSTHKQHNSNTTAAAVRTRTIAYSLSRNINKYVYVYIHISGPGSGSLEDRVGQDDDEPPNDVARYPEKDEVAPVAGVDDAVLAERLGGGIQAREEEDDRVGHVPPQRPELVKGLLRVRF